MAETPLPAPAPLPTIPATPDDDVRKLMRELRAALANVGELCTRLDTRLACHELAILTDEHKINTARERADEHERRIADLERLVGRAAE